METGSGVPGKTKTLSSITGTKGKVSFLSDDNVEITGEAKFQTIVDAFSGKVEISLAGSKDLIGDFFLSHAVWNIFSPDDVKRQVAVTTRSNVVGSVTSTGSSTTTRYCLFIGLMFIL